MIVISILCFTEVPRPALSDLCDWTTCSSQLALCIFLLGIHNLLIREIILLGCIRDTDQGKRQ